MKNDENITIPDIDTTTYQRAWVKTKKRKKKTVCKECGKRVKNWIVYNGQLICFECYGSN